jgi:2-methylcitrate dehydratase PrpD
MTRQADLLDAFAASATAAVELQHGDHAALLLTDHLLCVREGRAGGAWDVDDAAPDSDVAATIAAWSCARDRDEVDWRRLIHSGSVVWPVVMTLGRSVQISGATALHAAQAGYEAGARVAEILGAEHRRRFHPTATAGTVGAAAAAAVVLGNSAAQTRDTIGHALSVMGGSIGAIRERSGTRGFHRAHAVRTGIAAAHAARAGIPATHRDLEQGGGILAPVDDSGRAILTRTSVDAIAEASLRLFPTSGWNQCVFEAAAIAGGARTGTVDRVVVEASADLIAGSVAGEGADDEHWVSLRWASANAILGADASSDERRRVVELVDVVPREGPARVVVGTRDSETVAEVETPLGHPTRPATTEDLARKWDVAVGETADLVTAINAAWEAGRDAISAIDAAIRATSVR